MPSSDSTSAEESRTFNILLKWNGIIMLAAIGLISTSYQISIVKPCDLEKALDSLGLDINSPCTYKDIKNTSSSICFWGKGVLVVNFILFMMIFFKLMPEKLKLALDITFTGVALMFSIRLLSFYNDVLKTKEVNTDVNFAQIKDAMINLLEKNYTSDKITSSNAISNNLNKFFIEYNCCAINQVQGTTNDFDRTPWCTTSGSCHSTASKIPKTCCNGVSEDNYEYAPTACYSSVNPGTYKSNCMIAIKLLSATNIEESQLNFLLVSLLIIVTFEIFTVILVLGLAAKCAYSFFFINVTFPEDKRR